MKRARVWWLLLCGAWACADPVRERAIEALGPEAPGVRAGPLHRPGQPCVTCHDGEATDADAFSVAGTVYWDKQTALPVGGVTVELVDSRGLRHELKSNCAGNFYVRPRSFAPTYPLFTSLRSERSDDYRIDMQSPIGRDGSCASCHAREATQRVTEQVYLYALPDPDATPEQECP